MVIPCAASRSWIFSTSSACMILPSDSLTSSVGISVRVQYSATLTRSPSYHRASFSSVSKLEGLELSSHFQPLALNRDLEYQSVMKDVFQSMDVASLESGSP